MKCQVLNQKSLTAANEIAKTLIQISNNAAREEKVVCLPSSTGYWRLFPFEDNSVVISDTFGKGQGYSFITVDFDRNVAESRCGIPDETTYSNSMSIYGLHLIKEAREGSFSRTSPKPKNFNNVELTEQCIQKICQTFDFDVHSFITMDTPRSKKCGFVYDSPDEAGSKNILLADFLVGDLVLFETNPDTNLMHVPVLAGEITEIVNISKDDIIVKVKNTANALKVAFPKLYAKHGDDLVDRIAYRDVEIGMKKLIGLENDPLLVLAKKYKR